ncbi:hypothetical protein NC653_035041 [Populus alba x Populus x berolinensis]|uniref:Secreted protein n=1 Tax=Populus alba x Populus x berolinensis TaxID=444605 RepID=A0AAD6LRX1_9ROSI|nr:hypothetical protein NC653_035041 [Populus alba x Populus x berolinensis]
MLLAFLWWGSLIFGIVRAKEAYGGLRWTLPLVLGPYGSIPMHAGLPCFPTSIPRPRLMMRWGRLLSLIGKSRGKDR